MINANQDNMSNIMKGVSFGVIIMLAIYGFLSLFTFNKISDDDPNKDYRTEIRNKHKIYSYPLPHKIEFAGEKVPLENFDVRESLDYEILKVAYWQSEVFLFLKRAHRYFPIIEPILKKNNLPDDLKYFALAESGLDNVVSPAGAKGFWQFMEGTAKEYNLEVTKEVDERYNLEKATQAACEYFHKSYNKYHNWALSAAAYNYGQGNVDGKLTEQDMENYYDLFLNSETGRYVYRTIAIKIIMENPRDFGFNFREQDLYPQIPCTEVKVDSTIDDLSIFAKENGTNLKILKFCNPWLRKLKLTCEKGKEYIIKIPENGSRSYEYYKDLEEKQKDSIKSTE